VQQHRVDNTANGDNILMYVTVMQTVNSLVRTTAHNSYTIIGQDTATTVDDKVTIVKLLTI
jgi:hypothetical protein